eukprot:1359852-Amphidinium_carterae.3
MWRPNPHPPSSVGGQETTQELPPKAASGLCAKMATKRVVRSDTLVTRAPFCENGWVSPEVWRPSPHPSTPTAP